MDFAEIYSSEIFKLVILPLLIFLARVADVTLGTIRIIFVTRGRRYLAPLFGFFEIMIWILALGQIMQNLNCFIYYLAYGAGFAAGNFVGILIEERLAIGTVILRIITKQDVSQLLEFLQAQGFGITTFEGQGSTGPVKSIFTLVRRKEIKKVTEAIHRFNPRVFYTIEEVRSSREGIMSPTGPVSRRGYLKLFQVWRKGK